MVLFKKFLVHSAPTMPVALRLDSPPTIFSPLTKNPGCTTKSTCMIFKLFSQKAVYFADFLGKTDSCCVQKSFAPGCRRYAEFKIFRGSMPRTPSNYMPTARASRLRICKKRSTSWKKTHASTWAGYGPASPSYGQGFVDPTRSFLRHTHWTTSDMIPIWQHKFS